METITLASHWHDMLVNRALVTFAVLVAGMAVMALAIALRKRAGKEASLLGAVPWAVTATVAGFLLILGVQQFLAVGNLHHRHLCVEHHADTCGN